eukprot:TRINITY_DN9303_c0_g1_i1.p1 TRINITY_DN9303_c0_g1~~TRINITY_DN9303_c0_g1_i1.p1  ORF type:complete len:186 (-),score=42.31 TRINITY_DN9303_c0_g1_i1:9-566(-)
MLRSLVGSEMCIRDRSQLDPNLAYYLDAVYIGFLMLGPVMLTVAQQRGMLGGSFHSDRSFGAHLLYNACGCSATVLLCFLVADACVHMRFWAANSYLHTAEQEYPRLLETRGHGFVYRPIGSRGSLEGSRLRGRDVLICCLLYTSDAADEEDSGDLGGCRSTTTKTQSVRMSDVTPVTNSTAVYL